MDSIIGIISVIVFGAEITHSSAPWSVFSACIKKATGDFHHKADLLTFIGPQCFDMDALWFPRV